MTGKNCDIERIKKMETYLNECNAATRQLTESLEQTRALNSHIEELFQYYGSEEWYTDREAEIPEDIPAGVLSEDLIYNEITDLRDAAFSMLELATHILKDML